MASWVELSDKRVSNLYVQGILSPSTYLSDPDLALGGRYTSFLTADDAALLEDDDAADGASPKSASGANGTSGRAGK